MKVILRIFLLALVLPLPAVAAFAQCTTVNCSAGESCSYFEGAYCSSNYLCSPGQGCLTMVGTCSGSGHVCAIRGCTEKRLCPPNPYSVFAIGHAPTCSLKSINPMLRFHSARLFGVSLN